MDNMDKLPPEILCEIFTSLEANDQLTCRLVCVTWKAAVDTNLASVTHVKLNQNGFEDSFIPRIFVPGLQVLHFTCAYENYSQFFTFIAHKCPNVKVFSATTSLVDMQDMVLIASNLLYFEVYDICSKPPPADIIKRFVSLIAFHVDSMVFYGGFCHCNLPPRQCIQYSNVCKADLISPEELSSLVPKTHSFPSNDQQLRGLRWLRHREIRDESTVMSYLPQLPCLQLLSLKFYENESSGSPFPRFSLPLLRYFKLEFTDQTGLMIQKLMSSLKGSPLLQVLEVECCNDSFDFETFSLFTSALNHLEYLKLLSSSNDESGDAVKIHLNPHLTALYLGLDQPVNFVNATHNRLKYAFFNLVDVSPFNFPSLIEFGARNFDPSDDGLGQLFSSLRNSPCLQLLKTEFFELSIDSAHAIASFISESRQLLSVSVSIDGWDEVSPSFKDSLPPTVFISHPNLKKFSWSCDCDHFHLQLDNLPFDEILYHDQWTFTLRKRLARNNACIIDVPEGSKVTFSPSFNWALESVFYKCSGRQNEKCFIHLTENESDPLLQILTETLANSPLLDSFTFVFDRQLYQLTRYNVQQLMEKIASQSKFTSSVQ